MRISDWSSDVCSSDLPGLGAQQRTGAVGHDAGDDAQGASGQRHQHDFRARLHGNAPITAPRLHAVRVRRTARPFRSRPAAARSEEHTSELQSLMRISYAVFCLKKKKNTPYNIT